MYYKEKLNQQVIASLVGLSRSQVSRYLTEAEDLGIVRIEIEAVDDRDFQLESKLIQTLGLKKAIVVYRLNTTKDSIRNTIGRACARYLIEVLQDKDVIGITSGYTLYDTLRYLKTPTVQGLKLVQLMGGAGASALQSYPEEICRGFANVLGATLFNLHAPLVVENKAVRDLFLETGSVKKVVEMWDEMTVTVMGVGNISSEQLVFKSGWFSETDLQELLNAGAIGVACGRFFDANGNRVRLPLDERIISTELEVFKKVGQAIAVAGGPDKAVSLLAAVRGGYCNTVVTDDKTASEMLALAGKV